MNPATEPVSLGSNPATTPVWQRSASEMPAFPRLEGAHEADICIIGGGITGLTLAWLLRETSNKVILVEKDRLGSGTTGATSAHLDPLTDIGLSRLIDVLGRQNAATLIRSGEDAIRWMQDFTEQFSIDCHFRNVPGYLYADADENQQRKLDRESEAALKLGLSFVEETDPGFPPAAVRALRFDMHARFDPLKYLAGMARRLKADGKVAIHEHSAVREISHEDEGVAVATEEGRIRARRVVMATHYPIGRYLSVQARVFPYRSYLIAARVSNPLAEGLFWDLHSPYHYLRKVEDADGDLLLVGGGDHKTGHDSPERAIRYLEAYTRRNFEVHTVTHRWSNQYYPTDRGTPFVGALPLQDDILIATGYDGTGLTLGTVAAHVLSDLIQERDNPLTDLLRPSRMDALDSAGKFAQENWDVAVRLLGDRARIAVGNSRSLDKIAPGEGRVLRMDGETCAAARDENGRLHIRSAVCTHAHCIVQWNPAERSWDCPCHGGRFAPDGTILQGPPTEPLAQVKLGEAARARTEQPPETLKRKDTRVPPEPPSPQ